MRNRQSKSRKNYLIDRYKNLKRTDKKLKTETLRELEESHGINRHQIKKKHTKDTKSYKRWFERQQSKSKSQAKKLKKLTSSPKKSSAINFSDVSKVLTFHMGKDITTGDILYKDVYYGVRGYRALNYRISSLNGVHLSDFVPLMPDTIEELKAHPEIAPLLTKVELKYVNIPQKGEACKASRGILKRRLIKGIESRISDLKHQAKLLEDSAEREQAMEHAKIKAKNYKKKMADVLKRKKAKRTKFLKQINQHRKVVKEKEELPPIREALELKSGGERRRIYGQIESLIAKKNEIFDYDKEFGGVCRPFTREEELSMVQYAQLNVLNN